MGKLSKYSGVDLFEKYILPTNPSSKNLLWRNMTKSFGITCSVNNKTSSLKDRLRTAYMAGGIHCISAILTALVAKDLTSGDFIIAQLLVNIYPILVQLKTRNRIIRVLKNRENKGKTEEEKMETIIEDDIRQLKEIANIA